MATVNILEGKCEELLGELPIKFSYELDDFQKFAFISINRNENVLCLVPTGAGKSSLALLQIYKTIKEGKKSIYLSPIKALSNEKYRDFKQTFAENPIKNNGVEKYISVGLLTGDNKINPEADCLVMTTEILRNALYKQKSDIDKNVELIRNNLINNIGSVIIDEIHMISSERGPVYEELIVLLDPSIQLVLLSATISHAKEFAQWLADIKQRTINLIQMFKRPVPLKHNIYLNERLHTIMDENNKYSSEKYQKVRQVYDKLKITKKGNSNNIINESVAFLKKNDLLPALYFSFSRANCEKYANNIQGTMITSAETSNLNKIFKQYMTPYEKKYEQFEQYQTIKKLLYMGVGFHHSGMIPILKEIVEIVFKHKLIKVLFATETFAVGINMPAKTTVFTELSKYSDNGRRNINVAEYFQAAGRAGRRGIDTIGTVIILPLFEFPENHILQEIMCSKMPSIQSRFNIDYSFLIKIIQSESSITEFVNKSLCNRENVSRLDGLNIAKNEILNKISEINIDEIYDPLFEKLNKKIDIGLCNITLSKADKKIQEDAKQKINNDPLLKNKYDDYCLLNNLNEQFVIIDKKITAMGEYLENNCQKIILFLDEMNYIKKSNKKINQYVSSDIMQKGIAASYVNECNAILLTEIMMNGLFDDLESEEIVGLLGIFIDDDRKDVKIYIGDVHTSSKLHITLKKLEIIAKNIEEVERKHKIIVDDDYWDIKYNYIEYAYYWAKGYSIRGLQEYGELYEGNFVKNMLKIMNIVATLSNICVICNKIELLPKLEKISELVVRDIVTVNSLYLN